MDQMVFIVNCKKIKRKNKYSIKSEYNEGFIERIKNLDPEERNWNPEEKTWELSVLGLYALIKSYKGSTLIFFDFESNDKKQEFKDLVQKEKKKLLQKKIEEERLEENKKRWLGFKEKIEKEYKNYSSDLHSIIKKGVNIMPHQVVATLFANEVRKVLISHEMGLGKTLVSILFVEMNDFEKVVVLTPNSLKFNYLNEIEKFTNSKGHIVGWKKNKHTIEESKYVILNYDYFNSSKFSVAQTKWMKLNIKNFDALICDECQRLKNSKSNTYKNFKKIFKDKNFTKEPNKIFMSGTPAPNRAYELYNVLNQISPLEFKRKDEFYRDYCGMVYDFWNGWGYVTNTEDQQLEQLYQAISPYTHRKKKKDVLQDLPEKTYQTVLLEFSDKEEKEYQEIENATSEEIEKTIGEHVIFQTKPHHFNILLNLRVFLADKKMNHVIKIVNDIIDTGDKVIIIDFFKKTLRELKEYYGDIAVIHTGDQTPEERNDAVMRFQDTESKIKVFLGGMDVTKEGLTLTAANKMFLLTLPFVPGVFDQLTDRIHRYGQDRGVYIYIPMFSETIDDEIFSLIHEKKTELAVVMDNEEYKNETKVDFLSNIFSYLKNKKQK